MKVFVAIALLLPALAVAQEVNMFEVLGHPEWQIRALPAATENLQCYIWGQCQVIEITIVIHNWSFNFVSYHFLLPQRNIPSTSANKRTLKAATPLLQRKQRPTGGPGSQFRACAWSFLTALKQDPQVAQSAPTVSADRSREQSSTISTLCWQTKYCCWRMVWEWHIIPLGDYAIQQ